ncbi:MAG: hypothetical protein ACI9XP_000978 [Lentimonas sp.]|jgi:hypothetical protein
MKHIITASIFTLFFTCISFAQLTKGTYVLGGSASFSFNKTPSQNYKSQRTSFTISPGFGKFISDKYLVEGGLGYTRLSQILESDSENFSRQTSHLLSIRFGATRYFPIADQLYFTIGASISPAYAISIAEFESNGVEQSMESNNISGRLQISPGLTYFINKKWMLYSYMGMLNYEITYNTSSKLIGHNLYANLSANSFGLGARYIIEAKNRPN